jgi:tetratricopeptide (TPR) repeat protein
MPKPIKKKAVKAEVKQEDVQEVLSKLAAQAVERKKHLTVAGIAVLVVLLISAGAYLFNKNASQRALYMESEAFMLFSGVYETASERAHALEQALAGFRDANATRPTPFRKYYEAAILYDLGRYEECLKALDEFDSEYSSNMRFVPISRLKRAMVHKSMGNNEAALSTLQEFSFISSKSLKDYAIIQTAELLDAMGRQDEAQQYYSQVITDYPESRFAQIAQKMLIQPEPTEGQSQQPGGLEPFSIELK